jgi:uncharacterized NAD(P)/FAD-binding protein YdhS
VINALRVQIPEIWQRSSVTDRKRFLRHVMPYWNIHRHRVHAKIAGLLQQMSDDGQLNVIAGRVLGVEHGSAKIRLRHTGEIMQRKAKWLINCMGPSLSVKSTQHPLEKALFQRGLAQPDPLGLGFSVAPNGALYDVSGDMSRNIYTVGPPRKSACWESGAVPEIRRQCFDLAKQLMFNEEKSWTR